MEENFNDGTTLRDTLVMHQQTLSLQHHNEHKIRHHLAAAQNKNDFDSPLSTPQTVPEERSHKIPAIPEIALTSPVKVASTNDETKPPQNNGVSVEMKDLS